MGYVEEPEITKGSNPEDTFQKAVVEELKKFLAEKKSNGTLVEYFILEKFGLDIAIFIKWPNNHFTVRFFELKAFVGSRQGGVGFGNQKGEGSQIDLLLLENSQLSLANQFIRWVLVDGTKPKGSSRFAIFDNNEAKNAAMGGVRRDKQNNLRVNDLMRNAITWTQLIKRIRTYIMLKKRIACGRTLTIGYLAAVLRISAQILAKLGLKIPANRYWKL